MTREHVVVWCAYGAAEAPDTEEWNKMAIKVGDQMRLKSGGPKMTVTGIGDDGRVWLAWFNQTPDGRFEEHKSFYDNSQVLTPVADDEDELPIGISG